MDLYLIVMPDRNSARLLASTGPFVMTHLEGNPSWFAYRVGNGDAPTLNLLAHLEIAMPAPQVLELLDITTRKVVAA